MIRTNNSNTGTIIIILIALAILATCYIWVTNIDVTEEELVEMKTDYVWATREARATEIAFRLTAVAFN